MIVDSWFDNCCYSTTSRNQQIAYEIINYRNVKTMCWEEMGCWGCMRVGESYNIIGQPEHSPLSRGLREFTESRRPLPPLRGRACCSSFAVHSPFNPSPASPKSPRNSNTSTVVESAPVWRLFWDHWRRLGEWGWMGVSGETYRGRARMARRRRGERRVADGGKSNSRHLRSSPLYFLALDRWEIHVRPPGASTPLAPAAFPIS